jgi:hypothetical protein
LRQYGVNIIYRSSDTWNCTERDEHVPINTFTFRSDFPSSTSSFPMIFDLEQEQLRDRHGDKPSSLPQRLVK